MSVIPLFSTPIFFSEEIYEMSESFLDFIKNVERTSDELYNTSSVDSYILEKKEFSDLKKFIERQLDLYVHDILKTSINNKFYITQSWLNFKEYESFIHLHWHENSLISGVFYIDGDYSPTIIVSDTGDPPFGKGWVFEKEEFNFYNSGKWTCENKKNSLLMFPSTTQHFVDPYKGLKTRITLSFNTFVKGNLGDALRKTELSL